MAIIYSYPKATSLQSGDLIVINRLSGSGFTTMTSNINDIYNYVVDTLNIPTANYGLYAGTEDGLNISNTADEKTLIPDGVGSLSVPANGFSIGDSFRGMLTGLLNSANNQGFKIKVKINDVNILNSGEQIVSNLVDDTFSLNLDFTIRSLGETAKVASSASFHYTKQSNGNVEGFAFSEVVEIDTTIENTLSVTFQWGGVNAANSIQTKTFVLNKTY